MSLLVSQAGDTKVAVWIGTIVWNAKCDRILTQCIVNSTVFVNVCVNIHTNILANEYSLAALKVSVSRLIP